MQGFGGHDEPFGGCRSVLENFIGQELQSEVQAKIVRALGGELIDRAEQRRKGGFLVRTTRYLGPGHILVTTRTFDADGVELAAEQSEALTYVKLPEKVRQTIARVVGMIPVDESKIIRRRQYDHGCLYGHDGRQGCPLHNPHDALRNADQIRSLREMTVDPDGRTTGTIHGAVVPRLPSIAVTFD